MVNRTNGFQWLFRSNTHSLSVVRLRFRVPGPVRQQGSCSRIGYVSHQDHCIILMLGFLRSSFCVYCRRSKSLAGGYISCDGLENQSRLPDRATVRTGVRQVRLSTLRKVELSNWQVQGTSSSKVAYFNAWDPRSARHPTFSLCLRARRLLLSLTRQPNLKLKQ